MLAALVLLPVLVGAWLLWRIHVHDSAFQHESARDAGNLERAALLQLHFKTQVQEWKNILLRGADPAQLAKYRKGFEDEYAEAQQDAAELERTLDDPTARELVGSFLAAHRTMQERYLAALKPFVAGGGTDFRAADKAVKGQDRLPTDTITRLGERIHANVLDSHRQRQESSARERWWTLAVLSLLAAGCASMVAGYVRRMRRDLGRVAATLGAVAAGDLRPRCSLTRADEIGRIAADLDRALAGLAQAVGGAVQAAAMVGERSASLDQLSQRMASVAEETSAQSSSAAAAAAQAQSSIDQVGARTGELDAAIGVIARSSGEAATVAREAAERTAQARVAVERLDAAGREIGEVVRLIATIAGRTNLLALNAAIEAAGAGEAGRGFAVVAGEVKELARQTAAATEQVSARVEAICAGVRQSTDGIGAITAVVERIVVLAGTIAEAVDRQQSLTREVSANITGVVAGAREIAGTVAGASQASQEASSGAVQLRAEAEALATVARQLRALMGSFRA
jgi:methyl-accepting chemotaxis protein